VSPPIPDVPVPIEINLKHGARNLEIVFSDGLKSMLSAEYLRVHSPSAEVTGHSVGEGNLVIGKEGVSIKAIEPIGRYAVRLVFDDGHDSGLYTWPVLHDLSRMYDRNWSRYLERLEQAGHQRELIGSHSDE